jgi:hypothetical protein
MADQKEFEARIRDILKMSEKDPRGAERAISKTFETRRAPNGRFIFVPRGSRAKNVQLSASTFALMDHKRKDKRKRYLAKKKDPKYKGPKILAEGDSWFEYPCAKDLIDWLGEDYAVLSLARAGDTWDDINRQESENYSDGTPKGLYANIRKERPDIVMLSVGGNEIMGQIETYVHMYHVGWTAEQHILPNLEGALDWVVDLQYKSAVDQITAKGIHVILHGYDYPDARPGNEGGQWIGGPLEGYRRIGAVSMWRGICKVMLERFNGRLKKLATGHASGKVHYVKLLGTIGNKNPDQAPDRNLWWDEMHGTTPGFRLLAAELANKIKQVASAPGTRRAA